MSSKNHQKKDQICRRASELGFDDCRFTAADPPSTAHALEEWIAQGKQGEMGWIERNAWKRNDPQKVLPGAKSLVVLGIGYKQENHTTNRKEGELETAGIVARYARYNDYHDVLRNRLRELTGYIDSLRDENDPAPGRKSLWYVDTGPVLERDHAHQAGLGFVGKHTNLISRRLGNWFFIAEILTPLALEPDPPEHNRCGKCRLCIEVCPTGAITAPFHLDARKCISYLTIELKGSIPEELRPAIGNRIYGCDDCLEVCPWNRFAQEGKIMRDHARNDLGQPDLLELLSLDKEGFRRKFGGTPMMRTKRRGILRNVCVALGNIGDHRAAAPLEKATSDPEPLIAEHARWAVARLRKRNVIR